MDKIKERSAQVIEKFNSIKNLEIKDFPAPPFTKWLNGKVISASKGNMEVKFRVRPEISNPTGLLHGGMQSAMLDDVIGMTCATLGYEGFLITIDFHIDYLGKAKVGDEVIVYAKIIRDGKNITSSPSNDPILFIFT